MSLDPVDICIYPTSVRFKMPTPYTFENGLEVGPLMNSMTLFHYDNRMNRWIADKRFSIREETTQICSIPRYYLKDLVDYLKYKGCQPNLIYAETNPGKDVDLKINSWWKPRDNQLPAIEYLVGKDNVHCMRALPLQTGFGKSMISLFAASKIGKVVIVIVGGLIEQWYNVVCVGNNGKPPIYDIDQKDVYVIQGQQSLVDLIDNKDYQPKVLIASLSTMRNYIAADRFPYNEFPKFDDLAIRLGIGTKINDEAHMAFGTIVDVDLRTNIKNNIYLSATLTRGDQQSKKIFMKVFPDIIRYKIGEKNKYVIIHYLSYRAGYIREKRVSSRRFGYNHTRYEKEVLSNVDSKSEFLTFVNNVVASHYLRIRGKDEKCMIMASSKAMCDVLLEYFTDRYPDLRVKPYYDTAPDSNCFEVDIIISTVKKGGTGTDIANLRTVINTVSIGSEVLPQQILGRLRQLPNDVNPVYIAMYNSTLESQIRHYRFCKRIYQMAALEFYDASYCVVNI